MYVYYVSLKAQILRGLQQLQSLLWWWYWIASPPPKPKLNDFAVVASLTSWHMHLILERSKARLASAPRTSKWYLRGVSSSATWAEGVDDWMGVAPRRSSVAAPAVVSRLGASAAFSGRRGGGGGANEGNGDVSGGRC